MDRAEFFRRRALQIVARWDRLLETDPSRVAREARSILRWLEFLDDLPPEVERLRSLLIETSIEAIAAATIRDE